MSAVTLVERAGAVASARRLRPGVVTTSVVPELAFGLAVTAFAAYRLWQAFTGDPIWWTDSADYATSAVWAGARPPLVPLALGVTGGATGIVALQVVVAIVAWAVLARSVAALLGTPAGRAAAATVVLAFASTTAVVRWDRSVLSESLSMSTLALLLAALLWYARASPSWRCTAGLLGAAVLFAAARDPHPWVLWLLAIAVGIDAVVRGLGARALLAALGLALCAGAFIGGARAADRNDVNIEHVYAVRVFPYRDRVAWFADHSMPAAGYVETLAADLERDGQAAPVIGLDDSDLRARVLVRWLHDHGAATYARWLLEHPTVVVTEPLRTPERAYNNAGGNLDFYSAPGRREIALLDAILWPPPGVVAAVGGAALVAALVIRPRRRAWWWMVVVFGLLGVLHVLIAWHGDGMETTRHVVVGDLQIRLAVLVVVIAALEGVIAGSRRRWTVGHGGR